VDGGVSSPGKSVVSLCTNCYGRFGAEVAIERLANAGLGWVELPLRTDGFVTRAGDPPLLSTGATGAEIERVRRLLDRYGVQISSCNILSGNPRDPQVVEITRQKLELASQLGVAICVGDGGKADSPEDLAILHVHLRRIGDAAEKLGMTYCCETHPGLCQHPEAMLATMRSVDHPHVRLNFDTANLLHHNRDLDLYAGLQEVLPFVRSIHLKDTPGGYQEYAFPELGAGGAVDFARVRGIAEAGGFAGPYCIEIQGTTGEPEPTLEELHRRVVASVQTLRNCGYFGE
jgi:L-ribulose-5-phosphate 3-epimerase